MFALDPKLQAKFRQSLKRVLILEENPAYARMLSDMLRLLGAGQVWVERDDRVALDKLGDVEPSLIISEFASPHVDGLGFTRNLRRGGGRFKAVPLIMVKADITKQNLLDARNSGVHEILSKPFAGQDLIRRLQNVLFKPRDWVEVASYAGPCRRSFNSGEYAGTKKRRNDAGSQSIALEEAVRLMAASVAGFDEDPQAMTQTVMQQMAVIVPACKGMKNPNFVNAVQAIVSDIRGRALSGASLEPHVQVLISCLRASKAA